MPKPVKRLPNLFFFANRRSARDTLSLHLCSGLGYERHSIASPVYHLASHIFNSLGCEKDPCYGSVKQIRDALKSGRIPPVTWQLTDGTRMPGSRPIMQGLADGLRELFGEDVLLERLFEKEFSRPTLIDDCRLPGEVRALKQLGFLGVFINRPDSDGRHATEVCQMHYAESCKPFIDLRLDYDDGPDSNLEILLEFLDDNRG